IGNVVVASEVGGIPELLENGKSGLLVPPANPRLLAEAIILALTNAQLRDIHGLVRDEQGRKMSKSLGNGIDPIELIEKYGADTLRFGMLSIFSNGTDVRYSEDKAVSQRNFMNKIWNASRFVLSNLDGVEPLPLNKCKLSLADKWILCTLNNTVKEILENFDNYDIGLVCQKLYDFVWSEFCDWYIELSKPTLYGTDEEARLSNISVLAYVLDKILKLLHPIIPFVTEEIYQATPNHAETIMLEEYPKFDSALDFRSEAVFVEKVKELIQKTRNIRAEMNVPNKKRIRMEIKQLDKTYELSLSKLYIEKLCNAESVVFTDTPTTDQTVSVVCASAEAYIPLGDMVDIDKEIARIKDELKTVMDELQLANGKLSNERFIEKAPEQLVKKEREKVVHYSELKEKLEQRIAMLMQSE
ncbi:MAG: class I tRNA ligase family protein, partial [Clostridia bacterium]|nr:class I tRNA ligase family protein [Clostridia bacterium]